MADIGVWMRPEVLVHKLAARETAKPLQTWNMGAGRAGSPSPASTDCSLRAIVPGGVTSSSKPMRSTTPTIRARRLLCSSMPAHGRASSR